MAGIRALKGTGRGCCLLLLLGLIWTANANKNNANLYVFGGQSNMVGNTHGFASIGGRNGTVLNDMMDIILNVSTDEQRRQDLIDLIQASHKAKNVDAPGVAELESDAVLALHEKYHFQTLLEPLEQAIFTWQDQQGYIQIPLDRRTYGYSGNSYGPECMFAHHMLAAQPSPMVIRKAARGGTQIYKDWSPERPGLYWKELLRAITDAPSDGTFRGFVWFQGENDCFNEEGSDTSPYYLGNLTQLVQTVRTRMYQHADTASAYDAFEQIPVVIIELGYWPGRNPNGKPNIVAAASRVRQAQQDFVASDDCAALVYTADLCRFYHFDPASQLIIGDRVAQAMRTLEGCLSTDI